MEVKINLLREDAVVPAYQTAGAAGFDLAVPEDVRLVPNELTRVLLGFVVQTPPDHMLLVAPRSSTCRRWGIELGNTVGIVDEDYAGPEDDMCLLLRWSYPSTEPEGYSNWMNGYQVIPAGTRIAQGIFVPVTRAELVVTDENTFVTRGGWGSTGVAA